MTDDHGLCTCDFGHGLSKLQPPKPYEQPTCQKQAYWFLQKKLWWDAKKHVFCHVTGFEILSEVATLHFFIDHGGQNAVVSRDIPMKKALKRWYLATEDLDHKTDIRYLTKSVSLWPASSEFYFQQRSKDK
jgi:hypothetical protein